MLNHADNDIVEAGVVLFRNLFHFLNQLDRKIERLYTRLLLFVSFSLEQTAWTLPLSMVLLYDKYV